MRLPVVLVPALALCASVAPSVAGGADAPIPIKVVVVATFELGQDTGDTPGEFQEWVSKLPLAETVPFPAGYRALRLNRAMGVLGIVTGEGPTRSAASIEALGNDPRFDLTHAYFLLAGIAGVDPNVASPGSAVWARHVVDGDLAHEIDAREIPPGWKTGYVPLQRTRPYELPVPAAQSISGSSVFTLNPSLVDWAYGLTRTVSLGDTPVLQALRKPYSGYAAGQRPPSVLIGDTLSAGTFWIGKRMNGWAEDWVSYWTQGQGRFVTTAEEDAGFMQALTFLAQVHKVDLDRVMVLRTASNFDMPPPGQTPAELLAAEAKEGSYSGYIPSLDAAYTIGSMVVRDLVAHWDRTRSTVPGH